MSEESDHVSSQRSISQIPAVVHQHLECLAHNEDGEMFLGASSLTGRYWQGSLWYYVNCDQAPDVEKCSAGIDLETGIADLKYLGDETVAIGLDSGEIQLWQVNKDKNQFHSKLTMYGHDDIISTISISKDKELASSSYDKSIKIWDINQESAYSKLTYTGHLGPVLCIDYNPIDSNLLLSCGMDGRVILWDLRKSKPAEVLDTSCFASIANTLSWRPGSISQYIVGSQEGLITTVDIKSSSQSQSVKAHKSKIHRFIFHPDRHDQVASFSNDCTSAVTELGSSLNILWKDSSHSDYVRGGSWNRYNGKLYTCGWDFKIHSFNVYAANMDINGTTSKTTNGDAS